MSTAAAGPSSKPVSHLPNDARLIALLLAAKGIEDADERVLHQLMDFAHRYTSEIIADAASLAEHAGRAGRLEVGDVEIAVKTRSAWEFEEAAPKDYLLPIARTLNAQPLPIFSETLSHIRLPPREAMLGTANFRLIPRPAPQGAVGVDWADDGESSDGEDDEDEGPGQAGAPAKPQQIGDSDVDDVDSEDDDAEEDEADGDVTMGDASEGRPPAPNGAHAQESENAAKRKRPADEDEDYDAE